MVRKIVIMLCVIVVGVNLMWSLGIDSNKNVSDIIKLLKAKVGEEVIEVHIAEKGKIFDLSTKNIIKLKKAGANDDLIAYMIKAGTDDFPFEIEKDFVVKKPAVHKHLAIFPVFKKTTIKVENYLTLDEAQESKIIIITEKESESVPVVVIKNTGRKPIYIMAGEVIIGGKQDRMISYDVLIPAGKEVEVSVKCVEHGRWHGKSTKFKSAEAVGCKEVRSALQFKDQQEVWREVSKACQANKAETASGTYKAIVESKDIEKRSKPYLKAMKNGLKDKNMVGMIMTLNGEIVCVDIFANSKFFAKVKGKLLKAYVLDAIGTEVTSMKPPGKKDILAFFEELKTAKTEELKKYNSNCNYELETDQIIGNESRDNKGNLQHLNLYKQ